MNELSNQERLEMITRMIHEAKSSVARGGSNQILLWGWVIALANFGHFTLEQFNYHAPYVVWLIIVPAIIFSVYLGIKMKSTATVGHIDRVYGQLWLAIGIVIFFTLSMMPQLDYYHNPIIVAIAGAGMYITGRLLRYRPVLIGAVILWSAAIVESQVSLSYHYLISGIAVVLGYLIPGYMLKRSERE